MTMEKPDSWIISHKAQNHICARMHQDSVASHGHGSKIAGVHGGVCWVIVAGLVVCTINELEGMPVKMERMLSRMN